ncbi:hypothetical protein M0R45_031267 [Rubus argutus]|uniref:Uncharacterized protein n=1 Tax=Rubus argutus TaxID=59490 RepID=A0AAW1WG17_RUBAR
MAMMTCRKTRAILKSRRIMKSSSPSPKKPSVSKPKVTAAEGAMKKQATLHDSGNSLHKKLSRSAVLDSPISPINPLCNSILSLQEPKKVMINKEAKKATSFRKLDKEEMVVPAAKNRSRSAVEGFLGVLSDNYTLLWFYFPVSLINRKLSSHLFPNSLCSTRFKTLAFSDPIMLSLILLLSPKTQPKKRKPQLSHKGKVVQESKKSVNHQEAKRPKKSIKNQEAKRSCNVLSPDEEKKEAETTKVVSSPAQYKRPPKRQCKESTPSSNESNKPMGKNERREQREASRYHVSKMEKSVEFEDNFKVLKELEILCGGSHSFMDVNQGLPLKNLGLCLKNEEEDEKEEALRRKRQRESARFELLKVEQSVQVQNPLKDVKELEMLCGTTRYTSLKLLKKLGLHLKRDELDYMDEDEFFGDWEEGEIRS